MKQVETFTKKSCIKQDSFGNTIMATIVYTEDGRPSTARLFLHLKNTERRRNLGTIVWSGDKQTFSVVRDDTKHFHYAAGGYGFNDEVLRERDLFNITHILVRVKGGGEYLFPKHIIEQYGRYLHFKTQGFERQRFIHLNLIKNYKI